MVGQPVITPNRKFSAECSLDPTIDAAHRTRSAAAMQSPRSYPIDVPPVVTKTVEKRMNPTTKKMETAKVTKTVTITVTGTIWAYKPKPK